MTPSKKLNANVKPLQGRRIKSFEIERCRLSDYLSGWLDRSAHEKGWAPRTHELYRHLVRLHVEPHLGALLLGKISKDVIADYFSRLSVGSRTRQQVCVLLKSAFRAAVEDDALASNPIGTIPKHRYREFRSLSKTETKRLLDAAKECNLFALVYLALATGMRQGELFALRWEDIDFDNRFVSIVHSLTRRSGIIELRPPKGKRNRRVELSDSDLRILRIHRKLKSKQIASEWVFTNTEGKPMQRHNFLHRSWRRIVDLANLKPLRFHDLRHTSATLGLAEGMPVKVVQGRLGHASAKMTLDVYAKVVPSLQREAADKMATILGDWDTFGDTSEGHQEKNTVK